MPMTPSSPKTTTLPTRTVIAGLRKEKRGPGLTRSLSRVVVCVQHDSPGETKTTTRRSPPVPSGRRRTPVRPQEVTREKSGKSRKRRRNPGIAGAGSGPGEPSLEPTWIVGTPVCPPLSSFRLTTIPVVGPLDPPPLPLHLLLSTKPPLLLLRPNRVSVSPSTIPDGE